MRNCGDGLEFDIVHLVKGMVKNPRGIDDLESEIFVVKVTNKQALCREAIRLYVDIGSCDALQKA